MFERPWTVLSEQPPVVVLDNAAVLDLSAGRIVPGQRITVSGDRIESVLPTSHEQPPSTSPVKYLDAGGRCVLPGLVDCHVHVLQGSADLRFLDDNPATYVAAHASAELRASLYRGFTTVRDTGGADYGISEAVRNGLIVGPDIKFAGREISQTGGHGDPRNRQETALPCACALSATMVDGIPQVRRAARDILRRGADHIKIHVSGGVGSPTDRLESTQFSLEEIRAVVEEADAADRYVAAHAYTSRAIRRAVECGVRTIEHGNLLDRETADFMAEKGAFLVPTLAAYYWLEREGTQHDAPPTSMAKNRDLYSKGLAGLSNARDAGVKIAYGTDLLGDMRRHQLSEFEIRGTVLPSLEVLRSATSTAAELLREAGELGVVAAGARADLLVVEGNPLEDLSVLARPESHLRLIMKKGLVYHDTLNGEGMSLVDDVRSG